MGTNLRRLIQPSPATQGPQGSTLRRLISSTPQPSRIFSGGPLADVFDVLSIPQYATAGLATGKGITRGVQERTSFGELLSPGFRQTIPGRVAEFGLNVGLDPLTYVPIGGLAARGLRALPGGVRAIEAAKAPVRALAERAGLAIPETVRAARAVEGLAETKLAPLGEALRGVRSEQALARIEAAKFSHEFLTDIKTLSAGDRVLAQRLRELPTQYFDLPARQFVQTIRGQVAERAQRQLARVGEELSPEFYRAARNAAEQTRQSWLATLGPTDRAFVEKWGQRVATQHEGDLTRLVELGFLTPERADLWRGVYLRNSFLRHIDPERYADLIAKTDPEQAAEILAGTERTVQAGRTAGGIPGAAQIRPRKPLGAETQEALGLIRNLDERYAIQRTLNAELISRAELNGQVSRLYAIPQDQVQQLARSVQGFERLFRPMPSEPRWGELAGRWVPKEVHDILTATAWKPEGALATFIKLVATWKTGKVVMSPGTLRRNLTSNFALTQARFGSRGLAQVLREMPSAFDDVRNASELYLRAVRAHPGFGSSVVDAEVRDLLKAAGTASGAKGLADRIVDAVQTAGRPFTTAYEFSELVPKMALFRWGLKRGLSDKAAATQAMLTLFDYGDVPPAILAMRRFGLWPFVTFPYKVVTNTLPAIARHPGLLAQQVKAIRAATTPLTEEEQRALPESLRTGGFVKLSFTDWKGRPLLYDLSYELFFGDLGEPGTPIGQAVALLSGRAAPSEALPTFLTPIGQVAAEIAANRSFFTGQPIARLDEPVLLAKTRHVARAALPGPFFAIGETAATPLLRRAGLKPTSALARAVYGVPTARGVEPQNVPAALAQTFAGVRTVPLDVGRETQANVAAVRARLAEIDRRIRAIRRDQALRDDEKQRAIERLMAQKRQILDRFSQTGTP